MDLIKLLTQDYCSTLQGKTHRHINEGWQYPIVNIECSKQFMDFVNVSVFLNNPLVFNTHIGEKTYFTRLQIPGLAEFHFSINEELAGYRILSND
jgi:hypothetical protein